MTISLENAGEGLVQVGSHYHFYATNVTLVFEYEAARGMRLNMAGQDANHLNSGVQMRYAKLLSWFLLAGYVPSVLAHPFHDASRFSDSMLHPVLDANRTLVTDVVLLVMGIAAAILLAMRLFNFVMRKISERT